MSTLREKVIRLAYYRPEYRSHLLPILKASGWGMDVALTPLDQAKSYAEITFEEAGTSIEEVWPDFDRTYKSLQRSLEYSKDTPRILMPVIEAKDMKGFESAVKATKGTVRVQELRPTQSQIWFDKLVSFGIEDGPVTKDSPLLKETIVVSEEGHILDGHHRFASTLLANPSLRMAALLVPMDIDLLLAVGKEFSDGQGNEGKA